jgi:hypothetical protein
LANCFCEIYAIFLVSLPESNEKDRNVKNY